MLPRVVSLLALTLSLPCAAWQVRTDSQGDLVRWRGGIDMVLDSRAGELLHDPRAETAIRSAFIQLEEAAPFLRVALTVGAPLALGYRADAPLNQNSLVMVLEDWPYTENALAVTVVTINARTNEILDADIAFNSGAHEFRVLTQGEFGLWHDVQNTVTHELGHVLGLMHNAEVKDAVMFPTAPAGEVLKRSFKRDDRDGLSWLYTEVAAPQLEPVVGCSATASGWLFLPLMLLGLRRRAALLVALVPALALGAEPLPPALIKADDCALVQVVSRVSLRHPRNPGLFVTELTLAPLECLKGSCGALSQVRVAGGRVAELEQFVVHEPVPEVGERILVTRASGFVRVLRIEPEAQLRIVAQLRMNAGSIAPASPNSVN